MHSKTPEKIERKTKGEELQAKKITKPSLDKLQNNHLQIYMCVCVYDKNLAKTMRFPMASHIS